MLSFLSKHPIIGFVSGISSSLVQYINDIEPYIKAFGFITGIVIAVLTIYAKILEIRERRHRKARRH
jgi:hypothetical protein